MVVVIAEVLQGYVSPQAWTSSAAGYPVLQRSGHLQRGWHLFYKILWSECSLILTHSEEETVCNGLMLVRLTTRSCYLPGRSGSRDLVCWQLRH